MNILIPSVCAFLMSCNEKPVACLSSDPTGIINQPITVNSCSFNVDTHQWTVEGGGETIISGGDYCDKHIRLSFSEAGEKKIKLVTWQFKKKNKATCAEGLNPGKSDETTYVINIE